MLTLHYRFTNYKNLKFRSITLENMEQNSCNVAIVFGGSFASRPDNVFINANSKVSLQLSSTSFEKYPAGGSVFTPEFANDPLMDASNNARAERAMVVIAVSS